MSVIKYSPSEISHMMGSLFRNHRHFLWTEQERCMFIEHARHSNKVFNNYDSSEDTQQMDHLRWTFERIHLANQLEYANNYAKEYGKTLTVVNNQISFDMDGQQDMNDKELHAALYSLRYNSDGFVNRVDMERLTRWISMLASEISFKSQREEEETIKI